MLIRKMFKAGPFRLTISRLGLSESVGGRYWRVQNGGSGPHYTLRLPGTGLYMRRSIKRRRTR
jgi:hypothetical protein